MSEDRPLMIHLDLPEPAAKVHPLGPLVYRDREVDKRTTRLWAGLVLIGLVGLLGTAAFLKPDARGYGTHRSLGLPACGMVRMTGYPCPTCGMTTAFAHTVRGQWLSAVRAQPAGWLICLAVVVGCWLCADAVITGRRWRVNWYRIPPTWITAGVMGLLLGGWAFKIIAGVLSGALPASGR